MANKVSCLRKKTIDLLKKLKVKYKLFFAVQLLSLLAVSAVSIFLPYAEGRIINSMVDGSFVNSVLKWAAVIIGLFLVRMVLSYILSYFEYYLLPYKSASAQINFIQALLGKKLTSLADFEGSYLHNRVQQDIECILDFILLKIPQMINMAFSLLVLIFTIFYIQPQVSLLIFLIVIIYVVLYKFFKNSLYNIFYILSEAHNKFYNDCNSVYERLAEIKAKENRSFEQNHLICSQNHLFSLVFRNFKLKYLVSGGQIVLNFFAQIFILIVGGIYVSAGKLTIGLLTTIMQYLSLLWQNIEGIFALAVSYQAYLAAKMRMLELYELADDVVGCENCTNIDDLELKDFNIKSLGTNKLLFSKNLNLHFKRGHIYELRGKNGIGKSTLFMYLLGLYTEPDSGEIIYNRTRAEEINFNLLRAKKIAVLLQNEAVYDISVGTYAKIYLSEAADTSQNVLCEIGSLFTKLNNTPWTEVVDKSLLELSGGERQLLRIIVTLLKPEAEMILLDEPYNNLAVNVMTQLNDLLLEKKQNKIIAVISHAAELIPGAEEIVLE